MKRLLAVLLCLIIPSAAMAAARTASSSGLWSDTNTWGGAAVPVAADDCTISTGVTVWCDSATCTCGSLTLAATGANLIMEQITATKLSIGDGLIGGTSDNVTIGANSGIYGHLGQTLEINTTRTDEATSRGTITVNGVLVWSGTILRALGTITDTPVLAGSWATRTLTVVDGSLAGTADQYSGKLIQFTSGFFRWQEFEITTGAANGQTMVLKADTRGAFDSRNVAGRLNPTTWADGDWGMIYSTGTALVVNGTTTVTFSTAFASVSRALEVLLGSRFGCSADIGAAADTDFRTFCSITDTTHAELCTAYGTGNCNPTAAFRVYDDNQGTNAIALPPLPSRGDTYQIIDPAIITIPTGSQNVADPANHLNIICNNGSTCIFDQADIGWCGQDRLGGGAGGPDCLAVISIDNSSTSERFSIKNTTIHDASGDDILILFNPSNMTLERFTIHDAVDGGSVDGGEAHAVALVESATAPRLTGLTIQDARLVRMNDDGITASVSGEADNRQCDGCTFQRLVIGFTPTNDGGSIEGIEPPYVMTNSYIQDNLITNINGTGISVNASAVAADVASTVIARNVLLNLQAGGGIAAGGQTDATAITAANNGVWVVNNYIAGASGPGIIRGHVLSNTIDMRTEAISVGSGSPAILLPQEAKGNLVIGVRNPTNQLSSGVVHVPTGTNLSPATVVIQDNSVTTNTAVNQTQATFAFGAQGSSTIAQAYTIDHNSVYGNRRLVTGIGDVYCFRANHGNTAGSVQTYSNNLVVDCGIGIYETVNAANGTTVSTSNLLIAWKDYSTLNMNSETGLVTSGTPGFRGLKNGDLTILPGSTSFANLGTDGYLRGARVSGVTNRAPFLTIAAFLPWLPSINNIADTDPDADGVWSIHDDCDRVYNPDQTDTDADGLGDACDH